MIRIRTTAAIVVIAGVIGVPGCARTAREVVGVTSSPATGSNATLPSAFDRILREYEAAWSAKDAAALARLFAEDGFVLSGGMPAVRGRIAIEQHYQGKGGPLALRALSWARDGSIGYIIGEYAQDASFNNPGKFTLTLVRDDSGRWLIMSDMDNPGAPPPRSSSAALP